MIVIVITGTVVCECLLKEKKGGENSSRSQDDNATDVSKEHPSCDRGCFDREWWLLLVW